MTPPCHHYVLQPPIMPMSLLRCGRRSLSLAAAIAWPQPLLGCSHCLVAAIAWPQPALAMSTPRCCSGSPYIFKLFRISSSLPPPLPSLPGRLDFPELKHHPLSSALDLPKAFSKYTRCGGEGQRGPSRRAGGKSSSPRSRGRFPSSLSFPPCQALPVSQPPPSPLSSSVSCQALPRVQRH